MIRPKLFMAATVVASVLLTACSDVSAPTKPTVEGFPTEAVLDRSASGGSDAGVDDRRDRGSGHCGTEVTFKKWYTTAPFMTGFTCYGAGTYAGEILSRTTDGVLTQLKARYEVTDPRGRRSFKAVIEGTLTNLTGEASLTGTVIEGWRTGARVDVTFQRITPCEFAVGPSNPNVCFEGTIYVGKDKRGKGGDERHKN